MQRIRKRFSPEERQAILGAVQAGQQAGRHLKELLAEQGVSVPTYYSWRRTVEPVSFRAVSVTATQIVSSGPTLVSPGGYRVEGLALDELAQLLRFIG